MPSVLMTAQGSTIERVLSFLGGRSNPKPQTLRMDSQTRNQPRAASMPGVVFDCARETFAGFRSRHRVTAVAVGAVSKTVQPQGHLSLPSIAKAMELKGWKTDGTTHQSLAGKGKPARLGI